VTLRAGRDDDAAGFIGLIAGCWAEYPGCIMDLDGENPELRALASHFAAAGGALWAAEAEGEIVGMVAVKPHDGAIWELCRMYVAASQRGTGLATALIDAATAYAAAHGAQVLDLWTDTRFDRAHRFYERHGFVRQGGIRPLGDVSNSLEFRYAKPLAGVVVQALDTAAAASAARALGRVLQSCVDHGASVSFLPPLALAEAEGFYRRKAKDIAAGTRILLAAWVDGMLAGTVMLDLDTPPNQEHRAEIQKLLVHPDARRRGVARVLMQAAERAAEAAGRWLLTLDTREGDSAEQLYRANGWICAGRIPDYARNADGSFSGTVFFYKRV
jgi:GNAT superfamily N-acetyltransferase